MAGIQQDGLRLYSGAKLGYTPPMANPEEEGGCLQALGGLAVMAAIVLGAIYILPSLKGCSCSMNDPSSGRSHPYLDGLGDAIRRKIPN